MYIEKDGWRLLLGSKKNKKIKNKLKSNKKIHIKKSMNKNENKWSAMNGTPGTSTMF